jgi:radical SAM superfamily enzyme YgiQ (UPF0313 family)
MHQSGSILLVSCYELGHQPFAIASPAAFLKRAGYSPNLLDLAVSDFDETQVALADFVGISVPMHTALRLGVRAAERIRKINPSCHICFYGLYASLNAKFLLEQLADSVIGGEFEGPLVDLIKAISNINQSRCRDFEIDGVSLSGRIRAPYLQRLAFTAPSYDGLPPVEKYAKLAHEGTHRPVGYVEASRGCLHRCRHCPIPPIYDGRFFVVPEAVVLESISDLVRSGATHITFGDPDFLNGPGHSLRVVQTMHKEFPALTFDFTAKVEHLLKRRSMLPGFAEAGCLFVISAFESLSDLVLKNLNKGHSREDIRAVLEVFGNVGITLRPTWMPFTPWTTLADYIDLLEYVRREHLIQNIDPVQYSIRLLVPPGSILLQHEGMKAFLGPLDQTNFAYRWTHPDSRMDKLQENVTRTVDRAIESKEGAAEIFEQVRRLAYAAHGQQAIPFVPDFVPLIEPPRLTESWFC